MKIAMALAAFLLAAGAAGRVAAQTAATPQPAEQAAPAATPRVSLEFSTGFDYSTGSYGQAVDTEVLYAPFTARARTDRFRFEATLPYLSIEGPGNFVGGVNAPVFVPPGNGTERRSGLGDLVLGAGYSLLPVEQGGPTLELFGSAKLPTADEALGTGETDYTVQLNFTQPLTDRLSLVAGAGYELLGDPDLYELEDGAIGYVGFNVKADESVDFGGSLNYRHATVAGFGEVITATPYVSWRLGQSYGLTAYGTIGFTDASPDYGVGLQISLYR